LGGERAVFWGGSRDVWKNNQRKGGGEGTQRGIKDAGEAKVAHYDGIRKFVVFKKYARESEEKKRETGVSGGRRRRKGQGKGGGSIDTGQTRLGGGSLGLNKGRCEQGAFFAQLAGRPEC